MKKSRLRPVLENHTIQSRVHALAWTGKHAQAIDLASHELTKAELPPTLQMELLDLRSESYIAQGKLDLAYADASAMEKLAKVDRKSKTESQKLIAQALNRKALIQIRMGDMKPAVKTAAKALKLAHQTKQKPLMAISLFRLSEAQNRTGQFEATIETAQKAIALFQELGDLSGEGRAHWMFASACYRLNRAEDSRRAAQAALELCQHTGDQYGIGNVMNVLSFLDNDIVARIQHLQLSKQAFETAGYAERQIVALFNLGLPYFDLGFYHHHRRLTNQVIEMARTVGAKLSLTFALGGIITSELILGILDAARLHLKEFEKLVPDLGDPIMDSYLFTTRAELAFAEGDLKTAIRYYKSALKIDREAQTGRETITLTELAKMYLAAHDRTAALKVTTQATDLHRTQSFPPQDGVLVWWWHTQALNANQKTTQARETLDHAYNLLLEGIANIRDVGMRRNALNKVEDNHNFLQFWLQDGKKRKLPRDRLFAYLNIETNTREPFTRLANTIQRLNTLKTIPEIQVFLVEEAIELSGGERAMLILEAGEKLKVAESILPKGEEADKVLASIKKHLASARLKRTVQLILPKKHGLSRIIAPLIAQNQLVGYLYADMDTIYSRFDNTDRDMLGMLANQAGVALDNAGLVIGIELVYQDHLTGIFNRRYFDEKMQKLLAGAMADGTFISLLLLDVDNFKGVNDAYGHQTGDLALKIVADCLKRNSRKYDIVCRLGGDEFALVLVNTPEKAALLRAEKLREEIRELKVGNPKNQKNLTISVGVATFPHQAITLSELLKHSDIALYRAKTDGRNCVRVYDLILDSIKE